MKVLDVFEECRERVSARQAAEFYGLEIDRAGRARCCFHSPDRHPSMAFKGNGFRCWSCGAHGSSIDLVSQLYGLDALGAVRRLNDDFHLGLPIDRQQTPRERTEAARASARRRELSDTAKAFEAWRGAMLDKLTAVFRMAHLALKDCQTLDDLTEAEALAVKWQAAVEYWADCLMSGDMGILMDIFRDRKGVDDLCNQILNSTKTKSGAA